MVKTNIMNAVDRADRPQMSSIKIISEGRTRELDVYIPMRMLAVELVGACIDATREEKVVLALEGSDYFEKLEMEYLSTLSLLRCSEKMQDYCKQCLNTGATELPYTDERRTRFRSLDLHFTVEGAMIMKLLETEDGCNLIREVAIYEEIGDSDYFE